MTPNTLSNRFSARFGSPVVLVCGILMGLALFLRLQIFLAGRDLWLDEAALALSVLLNSPFQILNGDLQFGLSAPPGFLIITRGAVGLFGGGEMVIRSFPFLAGCATVVVWPAFWRGLIRRETVCLALFYLACSPLLARYSSEFKPYAVDAFVTAFLLAGFLRAGRSAVTERSLLVLGGVSAAAFWLSFPAVFVAGAGFIMLFLTRRHGRSAVLKASFIPVASFLILYFLSIRPMSANPLLQEFWHQDFLSWRFWNLEAVGRDFHLLGHLFAHPGGFDLPWIAAGLWMVGMGVWFRENRPLFLFVISLLMLVAAASMAGLYPFYGRLMIFSLPVIFLGVGEGACAPLRIRGSAMKAVGLFCLTVTLASSVRHAVVTNRPEQIYSESMRPVVDYVREKREPQDTVLVYEAAVPAFQYYWLRAGEKDQGLRYQRRGETTVEAVKTVLEQSGRLWVVVSHIRDENGNAQTEPLFDILDENGTIVSGWHDQTSGAVLYDLKE